MSAAPPSRLKTLLVAGGVFASVCTAGAGLLAVVRPPGPALARDAAPRREPLNVRTIDGRAAAPAAPIPAARTAAAPVAVMIDNWTDARPQYGLAQADVVYEGVVEYGITRFMAVYLDGSADRIEPVRSARTPYLPYTLEWGAVYAHVGAASEDGPADAEEQIRAWGVRDVDEDSSGGAIHRDPGRAAPHNAVTSTDALRALATQRGWTAGSPSATRTAGASATTGEPATIAEMNFDTTGQQGDRFRVTWTYDPATRLYRRGQAGAPHIDAGTGEGLTARTVVIQVMETVAAGDRSGHLLYRTEGTGRAIILTDGHAVQATWRKDTRTARTRYYDAGGREVATGSGATWIELLPVGQPLTVR